MDNKGKIALMVLVLALLVIRLFLYDLEEGTKEEPVLLWHNEQELAVMAELENREAAPVYTVNDRSVETNSEYAELYPDMYVTAVTPGDREEEEKIAYLTFDDGPSSITGEILDTLQDEGMKGTFFILGSTMTKEGEENLKRMAREGHTIGIHTYSHQYKEIYASVESFLDDFNKVYEQITELTGVKPAIFRFPWGSYNEYCKDIRDEIVDELERRGFTYYDWNVSAEDSVGTPTAESIMKNIQKYYIKYNQPVILMHDSGTNALTAQILPDVIRMIRESGYAFDTLDHREPCQFGY